MRIIKISSINKWQTGQENSFVKFCEEEYACQILHAANELIERSADIPIVLICGPSGSGKTISSLRLAEMLRALNKPTRVISMDNYFIPKGDPRNEVGENGLIDYESPKRVDAELLGEHIIKMLRCKEIQMPYFNFKEQRRQKGRSFTRKADELIILEGIHSLNPEVTGAAGENATGIYVSVRTRLQGTGDILLHPSKIRLLRRFVRDRLFRGRPLSETLAFFENVERGEESYIMPHKHRAEFDIDTFLPYEPCIYKNFVLEDLAALAQSADKKFELDKLMKILTELNAIDAEAVPDDSLVREFIGDNKLM